MGENRLPTIVKAAKPALAVGKFRLKEGECRRDEGGRLKRGAGRVGGLDKHSL